MVSDTDYSILMLKIEKLQARIESLEKQVTILNEYVDTSLKNKYYSTGCLVCGKYDCIASKSNVTCPNGRFHALASGCLSDAGSIQTWKTATINEDTEE